MDLDNLPRIFLLSAHLKPDELHRLEERIPTLTYDINEAELVVGKISQPRRAEFELRRAKLEFVPLEQSQTGSDYSSPTSLARDSDNGPTTKRRRVVEQSTGETAIVKVVKLAWLLDSWEKKRLLSVDPYTIYRGNKIVPSETIPTTASISPKGSTSPANSILGRALLEHETQPTSSSPHGRNKRRHDASTTLSQHAPNLLNQTTSEHDIALPLIPNFLKTVYSCQRPTYINSPNNEFVKVLAEIRTIRQLREDEVGERAYSSSIASIAAYPYPLKNPQGKYNQPSSRHL